MSRSNFDAITRPALLGLVLLCTIFFVTGVPALAAGSPPVPAVTGITPSSGPVGGATLVKITGTGFTGTTAVKFGTTASTYGTLVSDDMIVAASPAHTGGTVDVTVTTPGGTSAAVAADRFTYVYPVPVVTGISPTSGPVAGYTVVTITGTGFTGATAVKFGTTAGTYITVDTDNRISVYSPAHTGGTVDVTVTTPGGTSAAVAADRFTYVYPVPAVYYLAPYSGPVGGTTPVTIIGTGFTGATAVKFGTTAGTAVTVVSDNAITARSPAHAAGTVDVTVTTPGGTSAAVAADRFTYVFPVPAVTGLAPTSGSVAGTTPVTIIGRGFTGATAVKFGTTAGTAVTVVSDTLITARSPAHAAGTVDVTVTTPGGTSAAVAGDRFTYVYPVPAVTGIVPVSGPVAGTTPVTITGTGFTGATAVKFGGTAGTSMTVVSDTRITARSPAHAAGTVDVTVTTPGGTSAAVKGDRFMYVYPVPAVTGISPTSGPVAGTTLVTITGTGFTGATAIKFGGTAGTSMTVVSDTRITARSPAHAAGTVDVTVTTPGGTSAVVIGDRFTFK
jgi:hypothetical protein